MEIRDELKSNLRQVADVIPKLSEAILNLRNEVSEGEKGVQMVAGCCTLPQWHFFDVRLLIK